MLAHEALPKPAPEPRTTDPAEAAGGGGTRNAVPMYDVGAKRILHHLVLRAPVRTSALRGLGALPNVFALECAMDELAERAGEDPVAYRLSILSNPRARRVIERAADARRIGRGADRRAAGAAWALVSRNTRTAPRTPLWWWRWRSIRTCGCVRVWCAADAGLVINPDGARNQLEGGILQAGQLHAEGTGAVRTGRGSARLDWNQLPDPALLRSAGDHVRADRGDRTSHRWAWANARSGRPPRRSAMPWRTRWERASATCR